MLETILLVVEFCSLLVVMASLISLIPRDEWWIRDFDFPRLQIIFLGFACLVPLLVLPLEWDTQRRAACALLLAALTYQLKMVLPYTFIWPNQVKLAKDIDERQQISMIVSNVLTTNDKYHLLLAEIDKHQPDIILTLESDKAWETALSVIEPTYTHVVRVPLDNLYGMHLYSRLPLKDTEVKFLLSDDIPSIHTQVILRSGQQVQLYCLHPMPPSPTEAQESTLRDAELLLVGKHIEKEQKTAIVMGDLNDVAWSKTTRLFQRVSGLLDPRVGRHFINTFHADYPLFRWSLDHVFHSTDFSLIEMKRLSHVGSDHFPVLTRLQYTPQNQDKQPALQADADDKQEATDKIDEGVKKAETVINDKMVVDQSSLNASDLTDKI
ncbi:MAG: endonuclease [Moraxellaceae bacterium]|nr:MAG: endonuclease [Moraxellaceae bacterium]